MIVLGIDTSSSRLSIAVRDKDKLLAERSYLSASQCSVILLPGIKNLLREIGLGLNRIDGFIVGLGPGSFTGLRIGLSTIKALAFAFSKPIIGIPTLDVLAENISPANNRICPVLDARRGEVYSCIYQSNGRQVKRLSEYMVLPIRDLLKMLKFRTVFLGEGLFEYKDLIKKLSKDLSLFAPQENWFPQASALTRLGLARLLSKDLDSCYDLTPLYLRRSQAEEKYDARLGRDKPE
ncbi:MAG: tRNA (adenosine(37)-N6)-threonylcarbamoyltransferase complex dimerization subunit type 1 TsaB [Candidatus Omnitrophota bacterium]|nr:tRNA (adenosine(37)-N6)-threonylcarbamoyltransferase complex dimerization subunit type 1 TsaB [Candidatus Omnitrophota bacterium]